VTIIIHYFHKTSRYNRKEEEIVTLNEELIDVDDSVLLAIDVQDRFLEKYPETDQEVLKNRIGWVIDVAVRLQVPVIATAEDIDQLGGVTPSIAAKFPPDTPVLNKMIFGLADDGEIMDAIKNTGRHTAVLAGFETDVCVAQSAIGLLQKGYKVAVVSDASASPGGAHEIGLERMQRAGVVISSVKSLFYEWLRTVERCDAFMNNYQEDIGLPQGIVL
jgi:nicotinamidase-related amidase